MQKKTYKYKNLSSFKKYYLKEKKITKILLLVMLLASSLGLLLPYFYSKRLINITEINTKSVILYSIIIIIIISFHHIFWYLWEKLASILNNRVSKTIKEEIVSKMIDTSYFEIKNKSSGYYLERINYDVDEVSSFLSNVMGTIVDTLTNFGFLVLIYVLNYICGLIFTIGILILYIIDFIRIKKDLNILEKLKVLQENLNTKVNENYRNIKDIKTLGIKEEVIKNTIFLIDEIKYYQIKKDKINALLSRLKTYTQYLIDGILIIYSILYLIPDGKISIVILLMIIDYSGFMYDLVGFVAKMKDYFVKGEYSSKRIIEIIENDNLDNFGKSNVKKQNNSIRIENLSYNYEDSNELVLKNVNLDIKENTVNLFIGDSGSGKSTLFGILTKLLKVDNNKVYIGDNDINSYKENTFRNTISIINQDIMLFSGTILDNIKIVKPNASMDEIIKACRLANIYDDIMSFENDFNTYILENGNNLSGGQKQRISIARAILKSTPIILFDEPISALDNKNQNIFFEAIKTLKKSKTILIITHKTIKNYKFDNIYKLEKGTIIKN